MASAGPNYARDLVLFVKASTIDNKSLGECVFSHRFMMLLTLKGIGCKVIPVDMKKFIDKPIGFNYRKVPVLKFVDKNGKEDDREDIKDIEMEIVKIPPAPGSPWDQLLEVALEAVRTENPNAEKNDPKVKSVLHANRAVETLITVGAGSLVYSRFCSFIKNRDPSADETLKANLLIEMQKLNDFLKSDKSPGKFLDGDILKFPDCVLLPKLLHIKVAGGKLKEFEIPESLTAVHAYLQNAAEEKAFTGTAPSEDVIVDGWANQIGVIPRTKSKSGR